MPNDLPDWTSRAQSPPVEPAVFNVIDATSVLEAQTLVAAVVGKRIEVVQLTLRTNGTGTKALRGICLGRWYDGGVPSPVVEANSAISPESPVSYPDVPPGAFLCPVGVSLACSVILESSGLGIATVMIGAMYRLV